MPELRKDPVVERWVIVAPKRALRPQEFTEAPKSVAHGACPFCEGQEAQTPHETLARRSPGSAADGPGWQVRVVPNKYPALGSDFTEPLTEPLFTSLAGNGVHEVIIETPQHIQTTGELPAENLREVFALYRERLLTLRQDARFCYVQIFKNVGAAAGATLEHIHSQLLALPLVPATIAEELAGAARYHREQGRCVYCDLVAKELALAERIVCETPHFIAFCPYASRFSHETWIVPRAHASRYEESSPALVAELADVVRNIAGRIEKTLAHPAYNYVLHTSPFDSAAQEHYHWHIEVLPRVTKMAGFEWGAGMYINADLPEDAARRLREG